MTNCRHISLLTAFSKVFEKAMRSILSCHLPTNNTYVSEEHDFRKGGTQWRSWLRHCATSQKVMGSIPDVSLEFFIDFILPATLWPWD